MDIQQVAALMLEAACVSGESRAIEAVVEAYLPRLTSELVADLMEEYYQLVDSLDIDKAAEHPRNHGLRRLIIEAKRA